MSNEILEVEAVEISPLEQMIEQTLIKANVTDQVIAAMKEKYGGLKLKSVDDKESYLELCSASKEIRKIEIMAEKICEAGRSDAVKTQRLWISKQKGVLEKTGAIKSPIDADIRQYEDNQERIKQQELQRKEQAYMARQTILLKMEAKYENNCFTLGNASYEINNIKEADDEIWEEAILPKYKREFEKVEAVRAEEERKQKDAADKLRQEQELLAQQQEELRVQQEQFRKQSEELQKLKDDVAQVERDKQIETNRLKTEADNKRWRDRLASLDEIGWNGQYAFPKLGSSDTQVFTYDELVQLSDDTFNVRMKEYNESTVIIKNNIAQKAEEKRLASIEAAKQEAIIKEQERAAEQTRLDDLKKQQQEQLRQEELAKASDKEKYKEIIFQLNSVTFSEMKSPFYKKKVQIIKEKLEEINNL